MKKLKIVLYCLLAGASVTLFSFIKERPALYLVGDSTVEGGWGKFMHQYLDTTKIRIVNRAISGTSSRTFYTGGVHDKNLSRFGLWEGLLKNLKRGDVVIMQFGHNDNSPLADSARSRGSMRGIGEDTTTVYNRFLGRKETVHTYGWYLNRMVTEAKNKGAVVVVCSPIPMDKWKGDKVIRATDTYVKWSREIAENNKAFFLDLNNIIADKYDAEGATKVSAYFIEDHVHTNTAGSQINTAVVIKYIQDTEALKLKQYLKQ